LAAATAPVCAASGETIRHIMSRGVLRCGVSEGIAGFSVQDADRRWTGLDVDFCRALAAAILGDAGKVAFTPLKASARFPALTSGKIDVLARNTTWTLRREARLNVRFAGVLFFDGQGFLVAKKNAPKSASNLRRATVCVEKGTTNAYHLDDYSAERRLDIKPLVIDSALEAADAFFAGRCRALTSDVSQLAAARLRAPGGPQAYVILPERISKEPLGPVVRGGDEGWFLLVRWVLYALIIAEESGFSQDNVRERMRDAAARNALTAEEDTSKALGVAPGWLVRAVESVGNYGEMFERNVGSRSSLQLDRGLNRLWNKGGLMYAPPVR
jgi:general L-amino acid transport system substrate-binding protein